MKNRIPNKLLITLSSMTLLLTITFSLTQTQAVFAHPNADGPTTLYVSTTGLDSNTCITTSDPCLTLNGAIDKAVNGDTIEVALGTYPGAGLSKSITLSGGWDEGFTIQSGKSTIDGQMATRGLYTTGNTFTVAVDHFIIQNGHTFNFNLAPGAGVYNTGILTIRDCIITNNISSAWGGGIYNTGTLTIINSSIQENTAGQVELGGYGGGGGIDNRSILTINNSTIFGNKLLGGLHGGGLSGTGIHNSGTLTLNNSTVSGNTGKEGGAIYSEGGTITINNSTITANEDYGIYGRSANITIQNTIIAGNIFDGNTESDCHGPGITSQGYNFIGNATDCYLTPNTGDQIGTYGNEIDALLGPLSNNGGSTFTHALLKTSDAIDAGSPSTCITTDQRGVSRPAGSACDIGAVEGYVTSVSSITRMDSNPIKSPNVNFNVTFTEPVTGVDLTDFALTTSNINDAAITGITGSDSNYTVTIYTGAGAINGTIRLDLIDDDSILDASNNSLHGPGSQNGNYTNGEVYSLVHTPIPLRPTIYAGDTTPTFEWRAVPGAIKYQYQLIKGAKVIYKKTVAACAAVTCSNTPRTILSLGDYQWRIMALNASGVWTDYSPYIAFTLTDLIPGYWNGKGLEFYVTPKLLLDNFAIGIYVNGCGGYIITHIPFVHIRNKQFSFRGTFYANGVFTSATSAQGSLGLQSFLIPGCGKVSGGPYSWSARWRKNVLVFPKVDSTSIFSILPNLDLQDNSFTIERIEP